MIITFVHHSCFTVEMDRHFLIFDYFDGGLVNGYQFGGILPPFPADKKIYVFASHSHKDHFDVNILKWGKEYPNIHYILSKDIRLGAKYLKQNDIPADIKEKITFVHPMEDYTVDDMNIKTLRSTDAGVAFLVHAEDKNIYHAGDLNLWKWEGAGELVNGKETREYKREINRIKDTRIHAAFVVFDSRQGDHAPEGMEYFMKNVTADAVFPMHMWQDYSLLHRYKAKTESGEIQGHLVEIAGENEAYEI